MSAVTEALLEREVTRLQDELARTQTQVRSNQNKADSFDELETYLLDTYTILTGKTYRGNVLNILRDILKEKA